jgi:hypothetical protein
MRHFLTLPSFTNACGSLRLSWLGKRAWFTVVGRAICKMVDACMRWRHVQIPLLCCSKVARVISMRTERVPIQPYSCSSRAECLFCPGVSPFPESMCCADVVLSKAISISAAVGIAVVRALTCRFRPEDSIRGATKEPLHRRSCVVFFSMCRERLL